MYMYFVFVYILPAENSFFFFIFFALFYGKGNKEEFIHIFYVCAQFIFPTYLISYTSIQIRVLHHCIYKFVLFPLFHSFSVLSFSIFGHIFYFSHLCSFNCIYTSYCNCKYKYIFVYLNFQLKRSNKYSIIQ